MTQKTITISCSIIGLLFVTLSAHAGGGGCGDQCPKYKVTVVCEPAGQIEITDHNRLTNEWDQRSVDQLIYDFAHLGPLKVELLNTVWSTQPFDPKLFSQAWIHGLTEGESFGTGTQDLANGHLEYHGSVSPGWEQARVDIIQSSATDSALMTFTSYETNALLLKAPLVCIRKN